MAPVFEPEPINPDTAADDPDMLLNEEIVRTSFSNDIYQEAINLKQKVSKGCVFRQPNRIQLQVSQISQ
jgi:hypothetical protein